MRTTTGNFLASACKIHLDTIYSETIALFLCAVSFVVRELLQSSDDNTCFELSDKFSV